MDVRINKLFLRNFKGILALEIYADGENLKIYGDNATGKTTVFDAFTWLLFGKDSLGRSDFGIKTQDENGNVIHNLEHSCECELAIDNSILTLKRVYAEKWTKKRGSAEAEFSGHETKYFINEVPSTKKEYEQKIASIIDENLFKTITNPLYFNEHLKWQERRMILLSLCEGNMSDNDILARSPEFLPLQEELKGRTVEEYQKIIKSKQVAINDELKAIPQRINEAKLAIPETLSTLTEADKEVIEKKIAELNAEIMAIKNGAFDNTELIALKEQKREIEGRRVDVSDLETKNGDYNKRLVGLNFEIADCQRNIKSYLNLVEECEAKAKKLREEWHEVNNKQYSESEMCPTCGQPLPAEQIDQAKAKFNIARANKLEEITTKGKAVKAELEKHISTHDKWAKKLSDVQETAKDIENAIGRTEALITERTHSFENEKKVTIDEINSRIAEAEKKAQGGESDIKSKIYPIEEQIAIEKAKITEIDKAIAECELAKRQEARIADLEADEKRLAIEYAELDKIAYLIEKFTKYKVDMLSEEINSHFKLAKFKLFEEQINGGISECCEVTYKGVDYSDLNNASRINTGLDIINTLCQLNDKYAPVIVDNSESVTNILPTTSQMICLVVSSEDDMLRVEKGA
jgi:DNA repair exonuclease SbcCD ATPase subunit